MVGLLGTIHLHVAGWLAFAPLRNGALDRWAGAGVGAWHALVVPLILEGQTSQQYIKHSGWRLSQAKGPMNGACAISFTSPARSRLHTAGTATTYGCARQLQPYITIGDTPHVMSKACAFVDRMTAVVCFYPAEDMIALITAIVAAMIAESAQ